MEGFTRQETLALTGTTSSRLAYLDRTGVVMPQKYGNSKKPTVIYTWEQVLEIRAIGHLRQRVSLQTVRKIIQFLNETGFDDSLRNKHLVVVNDEVYWVKHDWTDMPQVMKVADKKNKGIGQFVLIVIPQLANLIKDVWEAAIKSKVVDFESFKQRAKGKPDQAA
jgi:DNA-binding transcriptional MerR regulator